MSFDVSFAAVGTLKFTVAFDYCSVWDLNECILNSDCAL